jgi:hypothetical protein
VVLLVFDLSIHEPFKPANTYNPPQRQMASLEGKIQAYEDVLRRLSSRFGLSDEQLMNIALTVGVDNPSLCSHPYLMKAGIRR